MLVFIVILVTFGCIPAAVSSIVKNVTSITSCRGGEFPCLDGTCISAGSVCDTIWDCPDGSDEASCYSIPYSNETEVTYHGRFKRQTQCSSRSHEWQCRDGTCISFDGKCDGKIDCPDKSDETHALCRNTKCQRNWFRCTYGACVDGTAYCNGVVECADQSDELSPKCRNDRNVSNGKFRCADGSEISALDYCDGIPNCPDGSDETVRACADQNCPAHLFQCAYGACVDQGSDCNGRIDCADASDEAPELCDTVLPIDRNTAIGPVLSGQCVLPAYPEHGSYVSSPPAAPGQSIPSFRLNITCRRGYDVLGGKDIFCQNGAMSQPMPTCVPFCKLKEHVSVTYYCHVSGTVKGRRICNEYEPSGTRVTPECNTPNYFYDGSFRLMKCTDGYWNYIATCREDCGRLTPESVELVGGESSRAAFRGEFPWHVAIYRKPTKKNNFYELICGGSLVNNRLVITAAHCFWNKLTNAASPSNKYAVAIAKLFSQWDHENDTDAQTSEITSIKIPERYAGDLGNQYEDIALVMLKSPFVYRSYVRPVCVDFAKDFNAQQLEEGNIGKVAGYGLIDEDGNASEYLRVVELPSVPYTTCQKVTPLNFRGNIGGDKICAGYSNGKAALCKGDSGGGLSFPATDRGITRFFLRGVASTAPKNTHKCNLFTITSQN